jgi:hypothetical protein
MPFRSALSVAVIATICISASELRAGSCVHPLSMTAEGPYQTAVDAVLRGRSDDDMTNLRALYAAQDNFRGLSALDGALPDLIGKAAQGGDAHKDADCTVLAMLVADFPLLETHYAAYSYYASLSPPDEASMSYHVSFFRAISDAVLATRTLGPDGDTFKVLSVGEEYQLLQVLGYKFAGEQALLYRDGVPYDRLMTDKGPVFFDISAFFGRELGIE